jgi:hypothetical protein
VNWTYYSIFLNITILPLQENNIWITCGKPMIILQEEALMYLSADYVNISAMIQSKIQSLRGIGFEIDFPTD